MTDMAATDDSSELSSGSNRHGAIAYKRDKRTKKSVLLADLIADRVITIVSFPGCVTKTLPVNA